MKDNNVTVEFVYVFGCTQSRVLGRICGHPIIVFVYLNPLLQAENMFGVFGFVTLRSVSSRGRAGPNKQRPSAQILSRRSVRFCPAR